MSKDTDIPNSLCVKIINVKKSNTFKSEIFVMALLVMAPLNLLIHLLLHPHHPQPCQNL